MELASPAVLVSREPPMNERRLSATSEPSVARRSLLPVIAGATALAFAALAIATILPRGTPAGVALVVAVGGDDPDRAAVLTETVAVMKRRLSELGASGSAVIPNAPRPGEITLELPGVRDVARSKNVILDPARLEMKLVRAGPAADRASLLGPLGGTTPPGTDLVAGLVGGDSTPVWFLVEQAPALSSRDVRTARPALDQFNLPAISLSLTAEGARKFEAVTGANVGRMIAVLLNDRVMSAPVIETRVAGSDVRITGRFTHEEASDLSLVMRARTLPAPLRVVGEHELAAIPGSALRVAALFCGIALALAAVSLLVYAGVRS